MEVKYILGDLVRDPFQNRKMCIVKSVEYNNDMCFTQVVGTTQCALSRFNALIGIPLTPQILEDNGWLKIEDKFYSGYQHPKDWRLQIQILKDKYAVYLHDEMIFEFNSVHQLQHLLFGLGLDNNLKI